VLCSVVVESVNLVSKFRRHRSERHRIRCPVNCHRPIIKLFPKFTGFDLQPTGL